MEEQSIIHNIHTIIQSNGPEIVTNLLNKLFSGSVYRYEYNEQIAINTSRELYVDEVIKMIPKLINLQNRLNRGDDYKSRRQLEQTKNTISRCEKHLSRNIVMFSMKNRFNSFDDLYSEFINNNKMLGISFQSEMSSLIGTFEVADSYNTNQRKTYPVRLDFDKDDLLSKPGKFFISFGDSQETRIGVYKHPPIYSFIEKWIKSTDDYDLKRAIILYTAFVFGEYYKQCKEKIINDFGDGQLNNVEMFNKALNISSTKKFATELNKFKLEFKEFVTNNNDAYIFRGMPISIAELKEHPMLLMAMLPLQVNSSHVLSSFYEYCKNNTDVNFDNFVRTVPSRTIEFILVPDNNDDLEGLHITDVSVGSSHFRPTGKVTIKDINRGTGSIKFMNGFNSIPINNLHNELTKIITRQKQQQRRIRGGNIGIVCWLFIFLVVITVVAVVVTIVKHVACERNSYVQHN